MVSKVFLYCELAFNVTYLHHLFEPLSAVIKIDVFTFQPIELLIVLLACLALVSGLSFLIL
ncbi:MAG: hypothetical protein LBP87_15325, partial [Planctomycetaceae bacterium]|nr:hypothetical protein [Planctomycetaceae bacterium]